VESIVSRKLSKPSLKNYLSTGKVVIEESHRTSDDSSTGADINDNGKVIDADKLLEIFSPEDIDTWGPVFKAGAEIKKVKIDLVELREFFRTMDRVRFTLYILENEKTTMRIVRSGVQIREPYLLFLLWDDTGVASIYISEEKLIL
jgi:hypothetical protein